MEFAGGCVSSLATVPTRYDQQLVRGGMEELLVLIDRRALDEQVSEQTDGELRLDP
jgi:hypothetical protein